MKWALAYLDKLEMPISINSTLDLEEDLKKLSDVRSASLVTVTGTGYKINDDEYVFSLDVKCALEMTCAITLKSVPYEMSFHVDEVFSKNVEDKEDINLIVNDEIDLVPVIYSDIVINKPMRVISNGAIYESEIEKEKINPAFEELKDFFK